MDTKLGKDIEATGSRKSVATLIVSRRRSSRNSRASALQSQHDWFYLRSLDSFCLRSGRLAQGITDRIEETSRIVSAVLRSDDSAARAKHRAANGQRRGIGDDL